MTTIDLVLPVYNEQHDLRSGVEQILPVVAALPHSIQLIITDNASTDATPVIARELAERYQNVTYLRLERMGRGHALQAAWGASTADIVAYMDIDLSTDLNHLPDLLSPIIRDEQDMVIGSRLAPGSHVAGRTRFREFLSRNYNRLLRFVLDMHITDAQCGFKAIRRSTLADLHALDEHWFYDTELIMLAERAGYRIQELPVTWVDDPDSRVKVGRTVLQDLRGVLRMLLSKRPNSSFARLSIFSMIGFSTFVGYFIVYYLLRHLLSPQVDNLVTLVLMTILNTALNRRFTFRHRGLRNAHIHYLAGFIAFGIAELVSGGGLWLLRATIPGISALGEAIGVSIFSLASTVVKYLVFSFGMGRRRAGTAKP